jgi:hypothetical protein
MIAATADQVYVHECAFEHATRYSTQDIWLGVRLTQINLLCMALNAVVQHPRAAPSGGYLRASPCTAVTRSNRAVRHRAAWRGRPGQIRLIVITG